MQEEGGHTQLTAPTQSNTFTLSVQTGKKENKTALKQALQHMKNITTSCLSTLCLHRGATVYIQSTLKKSDLDYV